MTSAFVPALHVPFVIFKKNWTDLTIFMKSASYWVDAYQMKPHPEGGYYAETYRSAGSIPHYALPEGFAGNRSFSTAIYFLLEPPHFSSLHRIQSDEIWHFYAGGPLEISVIDPSGDFRLIRLGSDPDAGEVFQAVVPAGSWFGARPVRTYALVGCTVAPGFDFSDFELGTRSGLLDLFPQHRDIVRQLTRPDSV
jgi:predicted cupin superfamily sugar epimerase